MTAPLEKPGDSLRLPGERFRIRPFNVVPSIPPPLQPLRDLAYNLWWTWHPPAVELFRRLDFDLWEAVDHNPVRLLGRIDQSALQDAARNDAYLAHQAEVMKAFDRYLTRTTWFDENVGAKFGGTVAYFSPEFGLHESLPVYSGGLGVLAGDHLKSASDLGLPLAGVGLLYKQGYFHQQLSMDGWQMEEYPSLDLAQLAMQPVRDATGNPLRVTVRIGPRDVHAQVWDVRVGRVHLFLLDSDVPENHPDDREITARLYGGDQAVRIRQEALLGIGGLRALHKMGIDPTICHMNEGHSAFLVLERIRTLCESRDLSFDEAKEAVIAGTLFTTHTPVPAGIDRFPPGLVHEWLGDYIRHLPTDAAHVMSLGQAAAASPDEPFSMAILALRLSGQTNGVSRIHGDVSRQMWNEVWPAVQYEEVPISSITNGIHVASWQAPEMAQLFDRYLGPNWNDGAARRETWKNVEKIPDAELWRTHERLREALVVAARHHVRRQRERRGAPPAEIAAADDILHPEALTIGFARRFAQYKRATLFLQDPERLAALLSDEERPVQFVVAGKAHPKDNGGKELIKAISQFSRRENVRRRIVFLQDYDIAIARRLVQGVDVWLNNPVKRHEASGTSGMKVGPNGGLNLSVLDGWWPEAYDGTNGWAIGDERIYDSQDYQRRVEAEALYELLEKDLVPMFFDRGHDGLPHEWIARMKSSIRTVTELFNTHRMVREYATEMYVPASGRWAALSADNFSAGRQLAAWRRRLGERWHDVRVETVEFDGSQELIVDRDAEVRARVRLGGLSPDDVRVQIYHGSLDGDRRIHDGTVAEMTHVSAAGDGTHLYTGRIPCASAGRRGFAVRVIPCHDHLPGRTDLTHVRWD